MRRLSITNFIIIGLLAWGLPSVFVVGPRGIVLTLATALPVWWIARHSVASSSRAERFSIGTCTVFLGFTLAYLAFDGLMGRKMLAHNMFLSSDAVADVVDEYNAYISQGRGPIELLGAVLIFLPFSLVDVARKIHGVGRWVLFVAAASYVFYDMGISRGYVLVAVMSFTLGQAKGLRNLAWAGILSAVAFGISSLARGDLASAPFSNPLFGATVFPFINLSQMLSANCGSGHWYDFMTEFFKKFLPGFIVPKNVFSFNLEMTSCMYPFFGNAVESISVFTYLGEILYYKPPLITALLAGVSLAILARSLDRLLVKYSLFRVRMFAGLMCIVQLRSRVQDTLTFLLSLLFFFLLWLMFRRIGQILTFGAPRDHAVDLADIRR